MSAAPAGAAGRYRVIAGKVRHMGAYKRSLPRLDDPVMPPVSADGQPSAHAIDDSRIPIFDQMSVGSCTANGGSFQVSWLALKFLGVVAVYARLFLYAMTRLLEGTPLSEDSGAEPRDVFLALAQYGIIEESMWPYGDGSSRYMLMPTDDVKAAASKHLALMFFRCDSLETIKQSILDDFPVGFGTTVFENFESDTTATTGVVTMPGPNDKPVGGHYMVLVGFDDNFKFPDGDVGGFKTRNSWGEDWGQKGYVWIPYSYWKTGLAGDNWTLRREKV